MGANPAGQDDLATLAAPNRDYTGSVQRGGAGAGSRFRRM